MRGAFLIVKKEFLELSKDRKTLFFTFVMPLLLYPLLFTMMGRLGNRDAAKRAAKPSRVHVMDPSGALDPVFRAEPRRLERVDRPSGDLGQAIRDQNLELALEVEPAAAARLARSETFTLTALYEPSDDASRLAL